MGISTLWISIFVSERFGETRQLGLRVGLAVREMLPTTSPRALKSIFLSSRMAPVARASPLSLVATFSAPFRPDTRRSERARSQMSSFSAKRPARAFFFKPDSRFGVLRSSTSSTASIGMETGIVALESCSASGSSAGVLGMGLSASNLDTFSERKTPAARITPNARMANILFI